MKNEDKIFCSICRSVGRQIKACEDSDVEGKLIPLRHYISIDTTIIHEVYQSYGSSYDGSIHLMVKKFRA